jgi:adenylate cyclase
MSQLDHSIELARLALKAQPSSALVRTHAGWSFIYAGDLDEALEHLDIARRLSPLDPIGYVTLNGVAAVHYFSRRFAQTVRHIKLALLQNPTMPVSLLYLAAALGQLEDESAEEVTSQLLAVRPNSTLTRARRLNFRHAWMSDLFVEGLAKAGLPE